MSRPAPFARLRLSLVCAWRGLRSVFASELHFRVHLAALVAAGAAGAALGLSAMEWAAVLLAAGLVLLAEVVNTALEYLADAVHPDRDAGVGRAKDAAAGGVLVAALAAAVVGAIVFLPKICELLPAK